MGAKRGGDETLGYTRIGLSSGRICDILVASGEGGALLRRVRWAKRDAPNLLANLGLGVSFLGTELVRG